MTFIINIIINVIINNNFPMLLFIIQCIKCMGLSTHKHFNFFFYQFFLYSPPLLAHLLQLDCCGPDVKACTVCSQLLWKENIPPIITSPSLLSWGGLSIPPKLHGRLALLTTVNRRHVSRNFIVTLQKTPWPLSFYIIILAHKMIRTRGRALTAAALPHYVRLPIKEAHICIALHCCTYLFNMVYTVKCTQLILL